MGIVAGHNLLEKFTRIELIKLHQVGVQRSFTETNVKQSVFASMIFFRD